MTSVSDDDKEPTLNQLGDLSQPLKTRAQERLNQAMHVAEYNSETARKVFFMAINETRPIPARCEEKRFAAVTAYEAYLDACIAFRAGYVTLHKPEDT